MAYPPLVRYEAVDEYSEHFGNSYCCGCIPTFDGIDVRFRKSDFDHCFYECTNRDGVKDSFSVVRAERIDWIREALIDENADLYLGWDSRSKNYDVWRRVAVVERNYVVVIRLTNDTAAFFVTAFVADSQRTLSRILAGPRWT